MLEISNVYLALVPSRIRPLQESGFISAFSRNTSLRWEIHLGGGNGVHVGRHVPEEGLKLGWLGQVGVEVKEVAAKFGVLLRAAHHTA